MHKIITTIEELESLKLLGDKCDSITVTSILQFVSYLELVDILEILYSNLKPKGFLYLQIPDMEWISKQIIRFESGQILSGLHADFEGDSGLQYLVFGSEEIPTKACFTRTSLWELLDGVGFEKIKILQVEKEIGILDAKCIRP